MSQRTDNSNTVLLVPCFNESNRLSVPAFTNFLVDHPRTMMVFVNDGSTDSTIQTLESIQQQVGSGRVKILTLVQNGGKAEAIRQGMHLVMSGSFQTQYQPSLIGYMDADLATPLSEIERLIDIALRRTDVTLVVGSRLALKGHRVVRTPSRKFLGRIFAAVVSLTLGIGLKDTQCGAKIFRNGEYLRMVFGEKFSDRWLFDIEILTRLRSGYAAEVYECPLEEWRDVGSSRLRMRDFMIAPWKLCQLAYTYRVKPACLRWIRGAKQIQPNDPAAVVSVPIRVNEPIYSAPHARRNTA